MSLTEDQKALLVEINRVLIDNEVSLEMEPYHEPVGRRGITLWFDIRADWTIRVVVEADDSEMIKFLQNRRIKIFDVDLGFITKCKLLPEDSTGGYYALFPDMDHERNYYLQIDRRP